MISSDVTIGEHVQLSGKENMFIDAGSTIGDNSWLNVCVQDDKIRLRIGRCVLIGRQSMLSTGGFLEIGDFCLLGPRVTISDVDHVYSDPNQPVIQQGATLGRSVIIEENCWLGTNVVVTGNVTVGRGSVVAANTTVLKDVPPFSVVAGNPSKIVKMYNAAMTLWEQIKNEDDLQRVLQANRHVGIPDREKYRIILSKNARISKIDPNFGSPKISLLNLVRNLISRLVNTGERVP